MWMTCDRLSYVSWSCSSRGSCPPAIRDGALEPVRLTPRLGTRSLEHDPFHRPPALRHRDASRNQECCNDRASSICFRKRIFQMARPEHAPAAAACGAIATMLAIPSGQELGVRGGQKLPAPFDASQMRRKSRKTCVPADLYATCKLPNELFVRKSELRVCSAIVGQASGRFRSPTGVRFASREGTCE